MDRDVNVDAKHGESTEVFFFEPSRYCRAHTVNAISASGACVVCVFLLLSLFPSTDDTEVTVSPRVSSHPDVSHSSVWLK